MSPDDRLTSRAFRDRAAELARGLAALGIARGDTVAVWLPDRPRWFVTQYACAKLGAVVVALNPRDRAHELGYILGQSDATALVLADHLGPVDYFEILHEVLPGLTHAVPVSARCCASATSWWRPARSRRSSCRIRRCTRAFVVGVPDAQTNEAAVAYVIPKPGEAPTEDEARAFCRGRIASFKIPRAVRFVDDVPRTPSPHGEKVQRGKLREQALLDFQIGGSP